MEGKDHRYFKCNDCGRTLREEELLTHLEYDQRMKERSWVPSIGDHSDWWYEKIEPLKLEEGEIVMVCRFCGEIRPENVEPTTEGRSVADLRIVMKLLEDSDNEERQDIEREREKLERTLNDFHYSPYILDLKNVKEKMKKSSGSFHVYDDGSVRFEDVVRKRGRYYKVPVYHWEKVANEYAEPTSMLELYDEKEGWLVEEESFGKFDHKKSHGSKITVFQEIDGYLLSRRVELLEKELAELKDIVNEMRGR
jgi:hypothetical protein